MSSPNQKNRNIDSYNLSINNRNQSQNSNLSLSINNRNQNNKNNQNAVSQIEREILNSNSPLVFYEKNLEEINLNGQKGFLLNKSEIENFQGQIPLHEFPINEDKNPEIIKKNSKQQVEYLQEIGIRYLRQPSAPLAGDIVIQQENNQKIKSAPPLIIRQQPARQKSPEPLVIREVKLNSN